VIYCDEYLFVCLFIRITRKPLGHGRISPDCLNTLPMALARSYSGCVAICYVLPVLWMPSCFRIMVLQCIVYSQAAIEHEKLNSRDCNQILLKTMKTNKYLSWVVHWGWSLLSMIAFLFLRKNHCFRIFKIHFKSNIILSERNPEAVRCLSCVSGIADIVGVLNVSDGAWSSAWRRPQPNRTVYVESNRPRTAYCRSKNNAKSLSVSW